MFENVSRAVFVEGALPEKTKQLIAVAVAHVIQCPYCIQGHTRLAQRRGNSPEGIMEAIWVAAEMRVGGAYTRSTLALPREGRDRTSLMTRADGGCGGAGQGSAHPYDACAREQVAVTRGRRRAARRRAAGHPPSDGAR
ncbi:carboxymuconolactone decarboxylase family protein [Streptomyces sp. NPDC048196]|uniref:carboxymuconolactone decarboxylase family protein n=1 Tax=Streptomyces sp. NPDC048196 TaxID=3154712 RepID=UPI003410D53B